LETVSAPATLSSPIATSLPEPLKNVCPPFVDRNNWCNGFLCWRHYSGVISWWLMQCGRGYISVFSVL
jgi:hypothetical protein